MTQQNNSGAALARRPSQSVSRWDPWSDMSRMQRQVDDIFSSVFGYTPLSRLMNGTTAGAFAGDASFTPDIFETSDEIVLIAPLPGLDSGNLNVEATSDTVTIKGERKPFYTNENAKRHTQSFWSATYGPFEYSYRLPV